MRFFTMTAEKAQMKVTETNAESLQRAVTAGDAWVTCHFVQSHSLRPRLLTLTDDGWQTGHRIVNAGEDPIIEWICNQLKAHKPQCTTWDLCDSDSWPLYAAKCPAVCYMQSTRERRLGITLHLTLRSPSWYENLPSTVARKWHAPSETFHSTIVTPLPPYLHPTPTPLPLYSCFIKLWSGSRVMGVESE